jgi:hypothetical protein
MSIEHEVQAVVEAFGLALLANDAPRIADYFIDEWVYVGPDGMVGKADLIAWIASGRLAHHTMEAVGPEHAVAMREALLVSSRQVSTGSWEGEP